MNISFNRMFTNGLAVVKSSAVELITPLQKKVALVALTIFSLVAVAYCVYRSYFFKAQKQDHLASENLKEIKEIQEIIEVFKHNKEIPVRLEKNRLYAKLQQCQELPKGFVIIEGEIPAEIEIKETVAGLEVITNRLLNSGGKKVGNLQVGVADCQGKRDEMEDAHFGDEISFSINSKDYQASVFGVFDGHKGIEAANDVKDNLAEKLGQTLKEFNQENLTEEGIFKALKACFQYLDEDLMDPDAGTTATVAILLEGAIWIANVGDSRTTLVKNGIATQASEDAKPGIERYRKKIEKLGGEVNRAEDSKVFRVNGELAVARAIGDKNVGKFITIVDQEGNKREEAQCCISPLPKITKYSLTEFKDGYVVLACDGLYDVATTNEVGQAIQQMANQKPEEMAKRLVHSAITRGSMDNVSVMVVKL